MLPHRETQSLLNTLAGSLTPTTLAAMLNDLAENDQVTEYLDGLVAFAQRQFKRQLVAMVGEREADQMLGQPGQSTPTNNAGRTYQVVIRLEGNEYVARDANGDWRTRGSADKAPATSGRALAEYLFHANEIAAVDVVNGETVVTIET